MATPTTTLAAQRAWLDANGHKVIERASVPGVPVARKPRHTISGQSALGVATHGLTLADGDDWVEAT